MKVTFTNQSTNNYYANASFKGSLRNALRPRPIEDKFVKTATKTSEKATAGFLGSLLLFLGCRSEAKESKEMQNIIHQQTSRGLYGELYMHHLELPAMKQAHEQLKDYPKVLKYIHLTQNDEGKLPMHYAREGEAAEIGKVFKDSPGVMKRIYLTKNYKGKTPLFYATSDMIENVFETFGNDPKTLKKIFLVKNKRDKYPIHDMKLNAMDILCEKLVDYPDILAELLSPKSLDKFKFQTDENSGLTTYDIVLSGIDTLLSNNLLTLKQYKRIKESESKLSSVQ